MLTTSSWTYLAHPDNSAVHKQTGQKQGWQAITDIGQGTYKVISYHRERAVGNLFLPLFPANWHWRRGRQTKQMATSSARRSRNAAEGKKVAGVMLLYQYVVDS